MLKLRILFLTIIILIFCASIPLAVSVSVKLSGPGAANDSTIKAGEKVSFDIYFVNEAEYKGFSLGFKLTSPDIKNVIHVTDSGNGLNDNGDIKGYNGWQDKSIWDLGGVYTLEKNWDGKLPELVGFGGVCIKQRYKPHKKNKNLSIEMIFKETGTIVIDSSFFPPTGKWLYAPPLHVPEWKGPYSFKVVK